MLEEASRARRGSADHSFRPTMRKSGPALSVLSNLDSPIAGRAESAAHARVAKARDEPDLAVAKDEQQRRRGASQPLHRPGIGQVDELAARAAGSSQLVCEAKQQRPLTASCLLRLAAAAVSKRRR